MREPNTLQNVNVETEIAITPYVKYPATWIHNAVSLFSRRYIGKKVIEGEQVANIPLIEK